MARRPSVLGLAALGVCLAVACGGAPAKSADDASTESDSSAEGGDADGAASASPGADAAAPEKSDEPEKADKSAGSAAGQQDVQAVLQLVIDDEELTPYLHMERADRFPIRIAGELPSGLELTKATQPVQVVDAAEAKKQPVIVFTEIEIQGDSASVRYRYDVEGVRGSCTLAKRDGRWVLTRSRVTARQ